MPLMTETKAASAPKNVICKISISALGYETNWESEDIDFFWVHYTAQQTT